MLSTLVTCAAVPLLLIAWHSSGALRRSPWPAVAVLLWHGGGLARIALGNIRAPHEWDFACFWLYGHIAAAHLNVYDPGVYARFASPFPPDSAFRDAVLNVGFPYPPPSIALFWPLGFLASVRLGLTLWYGVAVGALIAAAWFLARSFMPADGWRGALLILGLICALPAAQNTVGDAQTNFLLLLLVALALLKRNTPAGAVWTALAVWVKPYAAVLLVTDLIGRHWRRLAVAGLTLALTLAAGVLLVGPLAFAAYLQANPSAREPPSAFVEVVNQSLLSAVLRLHHTLPPRVSASHEPLYVGLALLFTLVTVAACLRRTSTQAAFAVTLLLGLIVYPGTLTSYGVMLILPLLVLWQQRNQFPGRTPAVALISAAAVLLQSGWLQCGFAADVLLWAACCWVAVRTPAGPSTEQPLPGLARTTVGAAS